MGFAGHRATLIDSVFDELGDPASWDGGATVTIRRAEYDDDMDADRLNVIVRVAYLRVRKSEVALPVKGQIVTMLDAAGAPTGESFRVSGDPQLRRNAVWSMPVVAL